MKTMNEIRAVTDTRDYDREFWNAMRFKPNAEITLRDAVESTTGAFFAPSSGDADIRKAITAESVIRANATQLKKYDGGSVIWAADSNDYAEFVPAGAPIPGFDAEDDFTKFRIEAHKVAGLIKLSEEFALDADFDLIGYITRRMGRSFARAEDRAFVNGSGVNEPHGLLHDTAGAETGVTTAELTYDDIVELFFSVEPEYRKNGVWMMNDRTALAIRKLKDLTGNYIWNGSTDTILGKPVRICNEMPDIGVGAKPVLFGDLSYYWIVDRAPVTLKALKERFALEDKVGYLGFELLDARLVRRDAVKAITIE